MKYFSLLIFLFITIFAKAQMVLDGSATGSCSCYTLTTTTNQGGSIWSPETIDLTNPFDFNFSVNLGFSDWGADGMVFVLRQAGTASGLIGSGMGYGGILNSIGIEIDTWQSDPMDAPGDIAEDHVGMNSNGTLGHNLVAPVGIGNIEDGVNHDFRVKWDPLTFEMEVFVDEVSLFVYTDDLVTSIFGGNSNVYFGWTAATGGASNVQTVCMNVDAGISVDDPTVCPGQEVSFVSTAVSALNYNNVEIYEWAWGFETPDISNIENPSYTYSTTGVKVASLTVTGLVGCTDFVTFFVTVDDIDVGISTTDVTCFANDNGIATAVPISGDAPYTYLWDDPLAQTTESIIDLAPGNYSVLVTDANGCEKTETITITEPVLLELLDAVTTNATCGLEDGEVELSASGGTPDYSFSIDGGGTFTIGEVFTSLPHGDLNVQIKDANDCIYAETVSIASNDLGVEMSQTDVTCFGFNNGIGNAIPEFGVGPCSFLWNDPLVQTAMSATNLAPGDYEVVVTHDAIGCNGIGTLTITEPTALVIDNIASTDPSCGVSNGLIAIEISGGTLPYQFSIDGGTSFVPTPSFNGLEPGTYTIVGQDGNNCIITDVVTLVNVSNVPDININADIMAGCQPLAVEFENLSDPLLTASTSWSLGDGTDITSEMFNHTYFDAGCYDVNVEITTFDGCTTAETFEDYICAWKLPIANFEFSPEDPDVLNNEVTFTNLSEFSITYDWDFIDGTTSTLTNPVHVFPEIGNVNYLVELIATTNEGCTDVVTKNVFVDEVILYFIPNAFTPDGDAFNDRFQPIFSPSFPVQDFHLTIFNKWGEIVWESYDPSASWDGTYGGELVADGVYIWELNFKENSSDRKYSEIGHVYLSK